MQASANKLRTSRVVATFLFIAEERIVARKTKCIEFSGNKYLVAMRTWTS